VVYFLSTKVDCSICGGGPEGGGSIKHVDVMHRNISGNMLTVVYFLYSSTVAD